MGSELAELFHAEAAEYLQLLNDSLLELEKSQGGSASRDNLDEMFRAAHSLKGMSATMGYMGLSRLTHRMEDLLDQLRQGEADLTPAVADLLFDGLDALEAMLADPETAEADPALMDRFAAALAEEAKETAVQGKRQHHGNPGDDGDHGDSGPAANQGTAQAGLTDAIGFQPRYRVVVHIADGAPMKSIRGHLVLRALEEETGVSIVDYRPDPLEDDDDAFDDGMDIFIRTDLPPTTITRRLEGISDIARVEVEPMGLDDAIESLGTAPQGVPAQGTGPRTAHGRGEPSAVTTAASSAPPPTSTGATGTGSTETGSTGTASTATGSTATATKDGSSRAGTAQRSGRRGNGRPGTGSSLVPDRIARVDTEQLDALVNLVGELVIYRVRLLEVSADARQQDGFLADAVEQLDRITDNLQHAVMSLRMVPVSQVFNRFPRVVRDISRQLDKQVELVTEGEDTELDRSIVHQLGDPLIHLIRNSLDHGLESPEERVANGKPPVGRLTISARHQGNHVVIEVADDGRGVNPDRIAQIALDRGLISPEELDMLTPNQKLQLIFRPGFSTARQVTDVSGRGVGMDAVRTVMESLNGQVDLQSEPGVGTRVALRLPLTLAIIPALLVRCGTEVYALPLEYVMQNLRLTTRDIHTIQGFPHIRWRDEILPVRSLADFMGLPPERRNQPGSDRGRPPTNLGEDTAPSEGGTMGQRMAGQPAVVIDVGARQAALQVDEIVGQQDIVIKNLGSMIGEVRGVAGATVLGNGHVALIVDLPTLMV